MSLCETCRNIDFVQLERSDSGVTKRPSEDVPLGLGLFYSKFERDIRTSTDLVLYHETLEDLVASAQLCDLCRLIVSPVEKVLANRRRVGKAVFYYRDLKAFQLWAARSAHDGVFIVGISRDRWNEAFVLCNMVFRVDEGKHTQHLAVPSLSFTYVSYRFLLFRCGFC